MFAKVVSNMSLAIGVLMTTIAACTKPQIGYAEFAMIVGAGLAVYGFSTVHIRKENEDE